MHDRADIVLTASVGLRALGDRYKDYGLYAYSLFYQNSPRGHDCHWCRKLLKSIPNELEDLKTLVNEENTNVSEKVLGYLELLSNGQD